MRNSCRHNCTLYMCYNFQFVLFEKKIAFEILLFLYTLLFKATREILVVEIELSYNIIIKKSESSCFPE